MKRNDFKALVLLILVLVGFYFWNDIKVLWQDTSSDLAMRVGELREPLREIITSVPLRGPVDESAKTNLTVQGILSETNRHRRENGLLPLALNEKLSNASQIKVDDMFAHQYFEHESPTGEGPGDLADAVGYKYLSIAENLALGNYDDDVVLVQAWMDSPGHRANILNGKYSEIGIAASPGDFEGRMTWLSVQEFGRPASECPTPDENLKLSIENNERVLDTLSAEIDKMDESPREGRGKPFRDREKVEEYNSLVNKYNTLLGETRVLIENYNSQIEIYNSCV